LKALQCLCLQWSELALEDKGKTILDPEDEGTTNLKPEESLTQ
jgi:hypothetical protein